MTEIILVLVGAFMIFGGMLLGILYSNSFSHCDYEDKGLIISFCGLLIFIIGLVIGIVK